MKRNRFLSALLCMALLLTVCFIPGQAAAEQTAPFDGRGTQDDPYLISDTRQMWAVARLVNSGDAHYAGAHYRLTANIDLGPADWVPIGVDAAHPFRGSFDGDGYGVTGMRGNDYLHWHNFQRPELEVLDPDAMMNRLPDEILDWFPVGGFFGVTQGAVIDDLYVEGKVFGLRHCGGLVGWAKGSQIRNCVVQTSQITAPRESLGTIVGKSEGSLLENNCYVSEYGGVMDLVGQRDSTTRIVNSFSTGRQLVNGGMRNQSSYYYRGDGTHIQVWEQLYEAGQTEIAVAISDLCRELNAWVDSQEQGKYRHWRALEGREATAWPVMADYLIEIRMEAPGADQDEQMWFSYGQFNCVRGYLATDGIYTAQAGRPPRMIGLDNFDGFQLAEVSVNGEVVGCELPAVTEDAVLTLSFARSGHLAHFTMSHPAISYPDVATDAWYGVDGENVVEDVTRLGLFVGRGDGNFAPEESLSLGEAVKLAAVAHSIYTGDGYQFDQTAGDHWYDTYKDYAVRSGILYDWEFDDLAQPATRLQMACLFDQAIPLELEGTLLEQRFSPSDIGGELERYQWSVRNLYWYGVLRGADQEGNFYPHRTITRAEAAAILVRLVVPERRFVSVAET